MNSEVTEKLKLLSHPRFEEIQFIREIIYNTGRELEENWKWNAPNFVYNNNDRITLKIFPLQKIQIVFHCGAKTTAHTTPLLTLSYSWLSWKANDRAVASFSSQKAIENAREELFFFINSWLDADYVSKI